MRFAILSLSLLGLLSTSGLAQSVKLNSSYGIAIAKLDTTPGADTQCPLGSQPVILTLGFKTNGISVRPPRLFSDEKVLIIRERKGNRVRDFAPNRRESIKISAAKAFQGSNIAGCWSEAGLSYRAGAITLDLSAKDYWIRINETFDTLRDRYDVGVTLSFRKDILRVGPDSKVAWPNSRRDFWKHEEATKGFTYLGELNLTTSRFSWTFAPVSGDADPVSTTIDLGFRFVVLDAGVNPS